MSNGIGTRDMALKKLGADNVVGGINTAHRHRRVVPFRFSILIVIRIVAQMAGRNKEIMLIL